MNNKLKDMLSVCIFGAKNGSMLEDCIRNAKKLTDKIFFVDLGSDDESKSKASKFGASVVNLDSVKSVVKSRWVLFIKPDEKPVVSSYDDLYQLLNNHKHDAYGVMTKKLVEPSVLNKFQLVKSLGEYENVGRYRYVPILELRLAHRKHVDTCLGILTQATPPHFSSINSQAQDVISLDIVTIEQESASSQNEDNNMLYLKGELSSKVDKNDCLLELSSDYMSFTLYTKDYLDSFIECASLGFGGDKMYLAMLDYHNKFGYFKESKKLYETWSKNRKEEKNFDFYRMGGWIYANLLLIDQAIVHFENALNINRDEEILAALGKLYLVKEDKEQALFYLREAVDKKPSSLHSRIIDIVSKENWKHPKLSLCMIAKDEEKYILRCLKSLENIADEIIVVDTGSADTTREIARKSGAKVITTTWNDDFSAARNLALREATGDYILFMDADEFIDSRQRFPLVCFKAVLPPKRDFAFQVRVEAEEKDEEVTALLRISVWNKTHYQVRLFPNNPDIRFQGRAFEGVDESLKRVGIEVSRDDVFKISHDISDIKWRAKRKKQAVLKSFHGIRSREHLFEGGLLFLVLDDYENAYVWLKDSNMADPRATAKIVLLYLKKDQVKRAHKIAQRGLHRWPQSLDLIVVLASIKFKEEKFKDVVELLKDHISSIEGELGREPASEALYYYGISLIETENVTQGIESLSAAIEKDPLNARYKLGGIYAFSKAGCWEEAITLAGQILYEAGKELGCQINDFSDVISVFIELYMELARSDKREDAKICKKIIEHIIHTQIKNNEEIEKIYKMIETMELEIREKICHA